MTVDSLPSDLDEGGLLSTVGVPGGGALADARMSYTTVGGMKRGTAAIMAPDIPEQDWSVGVAVSRPHASQFVVTQSAGSVDLVLDVGPQLLPWVANPKVDVASSSVTWTETAGTAADIARLGIDIDGTGHMYWQIAAPWSGPSLSVPALPELAAFKLSATSRFSVQLERMPGGWDAKREHCFSGPWTYPLRAVGEYAVTSTLGRP